MEYGLFPCASGWVSQEYNASTHKGIDVGWLSKDGANLPVRAWKSGTVIASGTDAAGAYYVVILHENNQWSGYWHLVANTNIDKGKVVKQGDTVGVRGNTGLSSGIHLHFLITKEGLPTTYNYNTMVGNTVNPIPLCYKYKTDDIQNAKDTSQYPLPIMPDVPKTVKRDESKHQVEVLASALRIRTKPSTSGDIYCIATQGLYNVLEQKEADGYVWDEIEKNRWIATNDKDGWTKDYPAKSEYEDQVSELTKQIEELSAKVTTLTKEKSSLNKKLTTANNNLAEEQSKNEALTKELDTVNKSLVDMSVENEALSTDLETTKATLNEEVSKNSVLIDKNKTLEKDLTSAKKNLKAQEEKNEVITKELNETKDNFSALKTTVNDTKKSLKWLLED